MRFELIKNIILMCFLLIFTFQDIRKKEIDMPGIIIFYVFIIGMYGYKLLIHQNLELSDICLGISSGIILMPAAKFNILGEGDAFVFIGSGALLGLKYNLLLLFITFFIVSFYALIMAVYCLIRRRRFKGMTVAMLPFVSLANCILWVLK